MKKIISLTLILFASIAALAQESRTIQKEEFDKTHIDGFAKYVRKAYRRREISQISGENPNSRVLTKTITETQPPGATRIIDEMTSPYVNLKRETVILAGVTYIRENEGAWRIEKPEPKAPNSISLTRIETQIDYKFLGSEKLENGNTTVYQSVEKRKSVNSSTQLEILSTITTKSWFGEDGGIIKQEINTEMRSKNPTLQDSKERISHLMRTTIWEMDHNIKIEAPTVK